MAVKCSRCWSGTSKSCASRRWICCGGCADTREWIVRDTPEFTAPCLPVISQTNCRRDVFAGTTTFCGNRLPTWETNIWLYRLRRVPVEGVDPRSAGLTSYRVTCLLMVSLLTMPKTGQIK